MLTSLLNDNVYVIGLFRDRFSLYIDYKYMKDMFVNGNHEVLKDVDWGAFGCHGKDGSHSTIWIGSSQAFTPLHKDTYGCNLVAQLSGQKSWSLFHPDDTEKLYPVRLPYEESSIFSAVDIENPDFTKHPKFVDAKGYKVCCVPCWISLSKSCFLSGLYVLGFFILCLLFPFLHCFPVFSLYMQLIRNIEVDHLLSLGGVYFRVE